MLLKSNAEFFFSLFFVGVLKVSDENDRIQIRIPGSISQRHGSADPNPDSHQNVMDPQHCESYRQFFE
jgi:hypothetical protein